MQPITQNLAVVPGTTYRDTVRLMQPEFAYRAITQISGAPAQVVAPAHGLQGSWPVWMRGVSGLPAANREPPNQLPHRATVLSADTLEVNALSAMGASPVGGQLVYRLPVDLDGATVVMTITGLAGADIVLTEGAGLALPAPGTVTRELTPAQTAQMVGDWRYTMDVTFADGSVTRYYDGGPAVAGAGCCNG